MIYKNIRKNILIGLISISIFSANAMEERTPETEQVPVQPVSELDILREKERDIDNQLNDPSTSEAMKKFLRLRKKHTREAIELEEADPTPEKPAPEKKHDSNSPRNIIKGLQGNIIETLQKLIGRIDKQLNNPSIPESTRKLLEMKRGNYLTAIAHEEAKNRRFRI